MEADKKYEIRLELGEEPVLVFVEGSTGFQRIRVALSKDGLETLGKYVTIAKELYGAKKDGGQ